MSDDIHQVKIRRERIYVAYGNKISVYSARGLTLLTTVTTTNPPVFDISYQGDFTMVYVDEHEPNSSVYVCTESLEKLRYFKRSPSIKAHENRINAIAVSPNNSLFATISDGRNIKLFRMDGTPFNSLHRGASGVGVRTVAFSPNGSLVAMISSNGTGNVFEKS